MAVTESNQRRFASLNMTGEGAEGADRYITFLLAEPAGSAAMAQEAGWESVESASVVTESLALASSKESSLLQPLAVNLINANEAADEIPIFLICESTVAGGPGELTRRFRMIGVVNEIVINSVIQSS